MEKQKKKIPMKTAYIWACSDELKVVDALLTLHKECYNAMLPQIKLKIKSMNNLYLKRNKKQVMIRKTEKKELSYTVGGNVNWSSDYKKQYGDASKYWEIELPSDLTIPL